MSSDNYLTVHQSEGVTFDSLEALQEDLLAKNQHVHELMESYPAADEGTTFITLNKNGDVVLYDREDRSHRGSTLVWGCWNEASYDVICRHMTGGKLVLKFEPEGWAEEYFVMVPGKVTKPKLEF